MKTLIIATATALILGAPLALAANTTLSARCTALGTQFDKLEATHKTNKNYKEALTLRSEGKSLCTAHKEAEGVKKLESAISAIGEKPMVKG